MAAGIFESCALAYAIEMLTLSLSVRARVCVRAGLRVCVAAAVVALISRPRA